MANREPDLNEIAKYIGDIALDLGLRDWVFEVRLTRKRKDFEAKVHPTPGRQYAVIRFPPDHWRSARHVQRNAVVHELLHCQYASASDIIRLDIGDYMGQATYNVLWAGFARRMEAATDALASSVDRFVAFPPWTEES